MIETNEPDELYVDLRPLGRGSGWTLAAWSPALQSTVVIRRFTVPNPEAVIDELVAELDRWMTVASAHIAVPIEAGTTDSGVFLTRPFIAGTSGGKWARAHPRPKRREVVAFLANAATTLATVHRAGLVHGAITTASFVRTGGDSIDEDLVVLVDPVPALLLDTPDQQTAMGLFHRAPEVVAGEDPLPASDVFAFASSAVELLLGHPIPAELDIALHRATDPDPDQRPTASQLAEALARAVTWRSNPPARPDGDPAAESTTPSPPGQIATLSELGWSDGTPLGLDALDALRPRGDRIPDRRLVLRAALWTLGSLTAIAVLGLGAWWWQRPDPPPGELARRALTDPAVAVEVSELTLLPGPEGQVEVTLLGRFTNRQDQSRPCPDRERCRVVLLLGRTPDPQPRSSGGVTARNLTLDARDLGVETSPRRGTVTAVPMNPHGQSVGLPDGRTSNATNFEPTRLPPDRPSTRQITFFIPSSSEILGVAILDGADSFLGFSPAADWIDPAPR